MLSDRCLFVSPVCDVSALWPNGWMDQEATWCGDRPIGPGHIVLDGDSALLHPKGHSPNFRPMSVVDKQLDGSRCHLVRR